MTERLHFVLPSNENPVGGINVLIRMAECLARDGRAVSLLYPWRRGGYRYWPNDLPEAYDPTLVEVFRRKRTKNPATWLPSRWRARRASGPTRRLTPAAKDWIVVPEFPYPEVAGRYTEHRKILVVQDVFGFFRAYSRDVGARVLHGMDAVVATSEASFAAVTSVYRGPVGRIILPVEFPGLDYAPVKKRQIAYMPRKRRLEATAVASVLSRDETLADFSICEISGVTRDVLAQRMMESLIFLSFSKDEGFGLPPAEAMRAGCIVIGMTGVGGREFFTPQMGIIVPDSDIVGMISATRTTIAEYREDPARLDEMRMNASRRIAKTYSIQAFEATTRTFWDGLS